MLFIVKKEQFYTQTTTNSKYYFLFLLLHFLYDRYMEEAKESYVWTIAGGKC